MGEMEIDSQENLELLLRSLAKEGGYTVHPADRTWRDRVLQAMKKGSRISLMKDVHVTTYLLYTSMYKEPRVTRLHSIHHPLVTFFIRDVIGPSRKRD